VPVISCAPAASLGALQLGQDRVGVGDERPARVGQRQPPAVALQQDDAGLALQRGQLLGDGRRGERQRLGGGGDGLALGELAQDAEAADVERHEAQLTDAARNRRWS
jgi:hypothetical protein